MKMSDELRTLKRCYLALAKLDRRAQERVLCWMTERLAADAARVFEVPAAPPEQATGPTDDRYQEFVAAIRAMPEEQALRIVMDGLDEAGRQRFAEIQGKRINDVACEECWHENRPYWHPKVTPCPQGATTASAQVTGPPPPPFEFTGTCDVCHQLVAGGGERHRECGTGPTREGT